MLKFCPGCGSKIEHENVKFCMNCGQSLDMFRKANPVNEKVSVQNDFLSEAPAENNTTNTPVFSTENQDDFFASMGDKADKENEADQVLLREAEQLFMKYSTVNDAKPILEDLSNRNVWRAQYMLHMVYEQGARGLPIDEARAQQILVDAVRHIGNEYEDDANAFMIVNAFARVFDVANDDDGYREVAEELRRRVSKIGNVDDALVEYELGEYYLSAFGNENREKALEFFESSAEKNFWAALIPAGGLHYYLNNNLDKAVRRLRPVANRDFGTAIILLTEIYSQGDNNIQHLEHWASRGAKLNIPSCIFTLATIREGEGNYLEAINLYRKNIQLSNDVKSMVSLGMLYFPMPNHPELPADLVQSEALFQQALSIEENNGGALFGLGAIQSYNRNFSAAKQLLQQAYNFGDEKIKENTLTLLKKIQEIEQGQAQNSGGCFVTTAVCSSCGKPDDCYELTAFRNFRDNWLRKQDDGDSLIKEYYAIAPRIVSNINMLNDAKEVYRSIWTDYLKPCLIDLESNNNDSCKERYVQMVMDLKEKYLK